MGNVWLDIMTGHGSGMIGLWLGQKWIDSKKEDIGLDVGDLERLNWRGGQWHHACSSLSL